MAGNDEWQRVEQSLLGLLRLFHDTYDPNVLFQPCLLELSPPSDEYNIRHVNSIRFRELFRGTLAFSGTQGVQKKANHPLFEDVRIRLMYLDQMRYGDKRRFLKTIYDYFARYVRSRINDSSQQEPYPVCVFHALVSRWFEGLELDNALQNLLDAITDLHAHTKNVSPEDTKRQFVDRLFGSRTRITTYLEALQDIIRSCIQSSRPTDAEKLIQHTPYSEEALTLSSETVMELVETALTNQAYTPLRCMGRELPRFRSFFRTRLQPTTRYSLPVRGSDFLNGKLTTFGLKRELGCQPTMGTQQEIRRLLHAILDGICLGTMYLRDDGFSGRHIRKIKTRAFSKAISILKISFDVPHAYLQMMIRVTNEDLGKTIYPVTQPDTRLCLGASYNNEWETSCLSDDDDDDDDTDDDTSSDFPSGSQLMSEGNLASSDSESDSDLDQTPNNVSYNRHAKPVDICPAQYLRRHRQRGRIVLNAGQLDAFRKRHSLGTRHIYFGLKMERKLEEEIRPFVT
jgi:hypothetical protein